jgi:phenylpropionate dioxygenase-like ring-hydroxylating dioxygenase large terminal subunit
MTAHALPRPAQNNLGAGLGLPNEHYTDPAIFAEERRAILFANWSGIGFGKDLPDPGDLRPVDFLGMPLLIVRDRAHKIRVFQNTCRHRGMILVTAPEKGRAAIRCPYHSWCYGLDGGLRATPHVGGPGQNAHPDLSPTELGLVEIRAHVWRDVIFVNVDGRAPAFATVHAELLERWKEFDQELHSGGETSSFKLEVRANWKLAVENFCESYHLPWVHPGLNSYSRLEDHYNIEGAETFSGQGTLVYRQLKDDQGGVLPDFPGLDARWDEAAEYVALYPNVLLGVHRDHAFAIVLEPAALDRTIEHVELYYSVAPEPASDWLRAENARLWKVVFAEDVFVVEGMQKGRHGPFFDGGRFSPVMDRPTRDFHAWVARSFNGGSQTL